MCIMIVADDGSPNGEHVAIGCCDGVLAVYAYNPKKQPAHQQIKVRLAPSIHHTPQHALCESTLCPALLLMNLFVRTRRYTFC